MQFCCWVLYLSYICFLRAYNVDMDCKRIQSGLLHFLLYRSFIFPFNKEKNIPIYQDPIG